MKILSWSQKNDPARIVVENFAIRIKIFLMVLNYQKSGFTSKWMHFAAPGKNEKLSDIDKNI